MKKTLVFIVFIFLVVTAVSAESPDLFSFTLGSGGAYDVNTGNILGGNSVGFTFSLNDTFTAGFTFLDIAGSNLDVVTVSVEPVDKVYLSMHSGTVAGQFGFGLGIGYSIFQKKEALFTSLGLFLDWFGANGGTFDVANGGVLLLGLKTGIGI